MTHRVSVKVAGLQPVQVLAALAGIAFVALGVVGFTRTGVGDFSSQQHVMLLGFALNPLHNLVHVVAGVLGLLMALGSGLARLYGWLLFLGYGAVFVWGLMITGVLAQNPLSQLGNPLALNTNDNWLHFGLALFGLLLAVMPARRKLIEEEPELDHADEYHDLPEQKDHRIESMDPTVSPRPVHEHPVHDHMGHDHMGHDHMGHDHRAHDREPITKEQAVIDPKTDKVHKADVK